METMKVSSIFMPEVFGNRDMDIVTSEAREAKEFLDGLSSMYTPSTEFKALASKYYYGTLNASMTLEEYKDRKRKIVQDEYVSSLGEVEDDGAYYSVSEENFILFNSLRDVAKLKNQQYVDFWDSDLELQHIKTNTHAKNIVHLMRLELEDKLAILNEKLKEINEATNESEVDDV